MEKHSHGSEKKGGEDLVYVISDYESDILVSHSSDRVNAITSGHLSHKEHDQEHCNN